MQDFEELDRDTVELVVGRDELGVRNETEVMTALLRWSVFECHRRQLDVNTDNQRHVLGHLIWHVRYLTMPMQEVHNAPIASKLLSTHESSALLSYQTGRLSAQQLPGAISSHLDCISTPRKYQSCSANLASTPTSTNSDALSASCRKSCITEKIFVCLACIFE